MQYILMSQHFKWYPGQDEVVVPWNATYQFPSQANKAVKLTPGIPPKNGAIFAPGQVIRLEFPAQGYVNMAHTTIEFDVVFNVPTIDANVTADADAFQIRFQNNIQSIFNRVRVLYGANALEDIINYNQVVRLLTEWTSTNPRATMDQGTITDGIGGIVLDADNSGTTFGLANIRQRYIQGLAFHNGGTTAFTSGKAFGNVGSRGIANAPGGYNVTGTTTGPGAGQAVAQTCLTQRYQVSLATGLTTQGKLIPAKYMASQLAIEITLEQAANCMYQVVAGANYTNYIPSYSVGNVNLIPEILEFDTAYDSSFVQGLRGNGVPIPFCSWHTYLNSSASSSNFNFTIQERSRSVKAIFGVQRRSQPNLKVDNGATFFDTSVDGLSTQQSYQYRIGGRYFPSAPVQTSTNVGSRQSNGGAEAYTELAKALNILGDYRLSTPCNIGTWALQNAGGVLQEFDFARTLQYRDPTIDIGEGKTSIATTTSATNVFSGTMASQNYASAISLETSNGVEISGLNSEEQSDISWLGTYKGSQVTGATAGTIPGSTPSAFEFYVYYDAMLILKENNYLELIQ